MDQKKVHHYGVIMVINSRRETQILTVGPDQLWPARERGGGGVMPSCTDPTLRVRVHSHCALQWRVRPGPGPLCTDYWPFLRTQPSQWQSGPGHNNTHRAASPRTCYEHSLENFGLDKWQPARGPPGSSCQLSVDLHPGDCQGKRIVFSFWSRWLDKTLWKCSSQWIMFYNLHPNWPLGSQTCDLLLFFSKIYLNREEFQGAEMSFFIDCVCCQCCCNVLTCPDNGSDCRFESLGNGSCRD